MIINAYKELLMLNSILNSFIAHLFPIYRENHRNYDRIYHVHIRKCAGTSFNKCFIESVSCTVNSYDAIAKSFIKRLKFDEKPIVGWNKYLIEKGCYWYGFSHIPFYEIKFPSNTFTFTFLRDPAERLLSHYNMINDFINEGIDHPSLKVESQWCEFDFDYFLETIPRLHRENQLYMFSPNFDVNEAIENLSKVSYVDLIESIEPKFIKYLSKNLDINLSYKHLRKSSQKFEPTEIQREKLNFMLKDEYEMYEFMKQKIKLNSSIEDS